MECNLSINLGAGFFWCLTLFISGFASFLGWHASRIYFNWVTERSLQRGQRALLGEQYVPLADRIPRPRPQPRCEVVELMRVKPPEQRPAPDIAATRPGWTRMDDYYYSVAAE